MKQENNNMISKKKYKKLSAQKIKITDNLKKEDIKSRKWPSRR